jgi:thioredoxin reductase
MSALLPVVIIGAGPYGLSLAAHLRARGVSFRIFGKPMDFWLTQMPTGMTLKSEGFASNLYDPEGHFTLKRFCAERGIDYADIGIPVLLSTFTAYGLAFKEELVPNLEEKVVVALAQRPNGFALTLDDDEVVMAQQVVLAIGISPFAYIPPSLTGLPAQFLSHSSQHHDLRRFKGKRVAVIGGGSSAIDLAGLLDDAGATVQLIARGPALEFHEKPKVIKEFHDTMWQPLSGIGCGWRMKILTNAPWLFHLLPRRLRHRAVRRWGRPAGGWFMKEKLESGLSLLLGCTLRRAEIRNDQVRLELTTRENAKQKMEVEHAIAATGYKVDLRRLTFISPEIQLQLKAVENTPILSSGLQSSIPGLYFAGVVTANSFGPVMRFAYGADFTARRLAHVLEK